jgi:hypothetical protein
MLRKMKMKMMKNSLHSRKMGAIHLTSRGPFGQDFIQGDRWCQASKFAALGIAQAAEQQYSRRALLLPLSCPPSRKPDWMEIMHRITHSRVPRQKRNLVIRRQYFRGCRLEESPNLAGGRRCCQLMGVSTNGHQRSSRLEARGCNDTQTTRVILELPTRVT